MKFSKFNRLVHRWGSMAILIPTAIILVSGTVLQLKKESAWIQPSTMKGEATGASLSFDEILSVAKSVPEGEVTDWDDVDRLDVRPNKGIVKIRCENRWEIQIDSNNGEILQVAYRRSDLIESLHDGSFFHDSVKLWIFFPTAIVLVVLWVTGIYLFALPYLAKWKRRKTQLTKAQAAARAGSPS
ncbi:MAG: PepSY-associated TM helix domain-containing protein [Planctomycetota bacterium]